MENENENKFVEYDKIETSSAKWSSAYSKVKKWAVTEKVHGANFSFIYNSSTNMIKYGKRTGLLKPLDNFFNFKSILPKTMPQIEKIIELVRASKINFSKLIVYGELFGGLYPGYQSEYIPVQKGVCYSPNLHFYAFDIYIGDYNGQPGYYLDFAKSIEIFKSSGILYAEPLAVFNKLSDALNYPIGFQSTIPKKLGLEPISNNKAEGIVVKSMTDRFVVKIKIPEFSETKYSDNSVNTNDIYAIAESHITSNRFANAVSKVGPDDIPLAWSMMVKDILDELDLPEGKIRNQLSDWLYKQIIKRFPN